MSNDLDRSPQIMHGAVVDLTQIDSGSDSDDELSIVSFTPGTGPIKQSPAQNSEKAHSESTAAPTSAYSQITSSPSTLMVIAEGRAVSGEIAYCFFDLATSKCIICQFADTPSYSRTIYTVAAARPQMILVPRAMAAGKSKAMVSIRRYLPWAAVAALDRRWFNDTEGMQMLKAMALPSCRGAGSEMVQ
ncbi:hypothetical protein GQ54DRAFT_311961 [Martensiomyces pterosporus]|nr:hypothetical protein GQ54DRAFT_311961 [Martensiomyces pterosporus]